jgi:Fe-S cluster biogenesis protein NfuA
MSTTLDAHTFQARLQRLEGLLHEAEEFADPAAHACTRQIVQAVLDLHAAGLGRLLDHLQSAGAAGAAVLDACARDDVTAGLLLLHGLHPLDAEARVGQALDQVRPYLRSHGGDVELLSLEDGIARLRLVGHCDGCPSSAATLAQTVEQAILAKAPDVIVEVERPADAAPDERPLVALPLV